MLELTDIEQRVANEAHQAALAASAQAAHIEKIRPLLGAPKAHV